MEPGCKKFLVVLMLFVPLSSLAMLPVFDLYVSVPSGTASSEVSMEMRGHVSVVRTGNYQGSAGAGQVLGTEGVVRRYVSMGEGSEKKKLTESDIRKQFDKSRTLKNRREPAQKSEPGREPQDAGKDKKRHRFFLRGNNKRKNVEEPPQPQEETCRQPANAGWSAPHGWTLAGQDVMEDGIANLMGSDSSEFMYVQLMTRTITSRIVLNSIPLAGLVVNTLSYQLDFLLAYFSLKEQNSHKTGRRPLSRQSSGDTDRQSLGQPYSGGSSRAGSFVESGQGILGEKVDSGVGLGSYSPGNQKVIERSRRSATVSQFSVSSGINPVLDSVALALGEQGFVDPLFGLNCTCTIELLYNDNSSGFALVFTIPDLDTGQINTVILMASDPQTITPELGQLLGIEVPVVDTDEVVGELEMGDDAAATVMTDSHSGSSHLEAQSTQVQSESLGLVLEQATNDDGYVTFLPNSDAHFPEQQGDPVDENNQYVAVAHPNNPQQQTFLEADYFIMSPAGSVTQPVSAGGGHLADVYIAPDGLDSDQEGDQPESVNPTAHAPLVSGSGQQQNYINVALNQGVNQGGQPVLSNPPPASHHYEQVDLLPDSENVELPQQETPFQQTTAQVPNDNSVTQSLNPSGNQEHLHFDAAVVPQNPNDIYDYPPDTTGPEALYDVAPHGTPVEGITEEEKARYRRLDYQLVTKGTCKGEAGAGIQYRRKDDDDQGGGGGASGRRLLRSQEQRKTEYVTVSSFKKREHETSGSGQGSGSEKQQEKLYSVSPPVNETINGLLPPGPSEIYMIVNWQELSRQLPCVGDCFQ